VVSCVGLSSLRDNRTCGERVACRASRRQGPRQTEVSSTMGTVARGRCAGGGRAAEKQLERTISEESFLQGAPSREGSWNGKGRECPVGKGALRPFQIGRERIPEGVGGEPQNRVGHGSEKCGAGCSLSTGLAGVGIRGAQRERTAKADRQNRGEDLQRPVARRAYTDGGPGLACTPGPTHITECSLRLHGAAPPLAAESDRRQSIGSTRIGDPAYGPPFPRNSQNRSRQDPRLGSRLFLHRGFRTENQSCALCSCSSGGIVPWGNRWCQAMSTGGTGVCGTGASVKEGPAPDHFRRGLPIAGWVSAFLRLAKGTHVFPMCKETFPASGFAGSIRKYFFMQTILVISISFVWICHRRCLGTRLASVDNSGPRATLSGKDRFTLQRS
jgi:hypothetical protein